MLELALLLAVPAAAFEPAPAPPAGQSVVYLYRVKAPPTMRKALFKIDGDLRVKLKNNSYSWVVVDEGSHAVDIEWGLMAGVPELKLVFYAEPNREYFFRLTGSMRNEGRGRSSTFSSIKGVTKAEALEDLAEIKKFSETLEPEPGKPTGKFKDAPPPPPGYGLVYFYRPDNPPGKKCTIKIDGKKLLKVPNKAYTWAHIPVGARRFQTDWGFFVGIDLVDIRYQVEHKKTSYMRIYGSLAGNRVNSGMMPVTPSLALKELARIKKYRKGVAAKP